MCASAESTNHHALSTSNGVVRTRGRISGLTGVLLGADTAFIVYIAQQMHAGALSVVNQHKYFRNFLVFRRRDVPERVPPR